MCSSKTFLGRSVRSSTWRKPGVPSPALPLQEKPRVGGLWSHSSLLPVWLFGEQFLGNGWLSRWPGRKWEKFHVLHLPVCIMPTIFHPQPAQGLHILQTDTSEQQPPSLSCQPCFPSWPAVKPMSCWFCIITCSRPDGTCQHQLPCCYDGQQPHTCPCASEVPPDPASLPICPGLHPAPMPTTALPTCVLSMPPQGYAPCSSGRGEGPRNILRTWQAVGALIKVNHEHSLEPFLSYL